IRCVELSEWRTENGTRVYRDWAVQAALAHAHPPACARMPMSVHNNYNAALPARLPATLPPLTHFYAKYGGKSGSHVAVSVYVTGNVHSALALRHYGAERVNGYLNCVTCFLFYVILHFKERVSKISILHLLLKEKKKARMALQILAVTNVYF
ncbi:jg7450, partial [Pararge aegeria aegeria]